ncbi:uncharacterized protein NMK_0381 [Novimethylophilus kurashikiensis]|uniref:PAS domain S-box protein n=1 Tax=Novimethylophilus kurashikiensis TaxID=1825523 RepID=A0A2R5F2M7_9PROT|nr:PAS domain S-box protein [Novimethylophilus kurashikiensis]GBG12846.1 uncharacterized protein NMK_0381 [Novimethylophilus kurashikiensis]
MMQTPSSSPVPDLEQAFYRHVAEDVNAPAFFVADPDDDFRLAHVSASCGRYGVQAVAPGMPLAQWISIPDTSQLAGVWRQLAETAEVKIETEGLFDGQQSLIALRLSRWEYGGRYLLAGHVQRVDDVRRAHDQALAELRRREQYQRTLLDNSPYFVWLKDEQSRLLAANTQYARVAGVADTRDLEGKTDFHFFPRELAEKYVADDREVMASGQSKNVEEEYCDEHGVRHWMETWKSPLVVDGKVVGTVGCSRDITERKVYEAAIQARLDLEQQYSLMAANLPGFLYICRVGMDGHLQFLHASVGVQALCGLAPEAVIAAGNNILELVHGEDREILQGVILDSAEKLTPLNVEFRILHPEKGVRWLHAKSTHARQPDGDVLGYGMMLDINERKQDEQRLRIKSLALSEAQRIARLGSWTLDLTDRRLTWSDEVYRIFEIDPVRFSASDQDFFRWVHPDDRNAVQQAFDQSLNTRKPYQIEHRLLMSDGRIKYVLERGEHHYGPDGNPLSTHGTVLDITERKEAEQALREREAFLDTLLDTLPLPVFYKDRAGRYLGFNRAYEEFFSASKAVLLGKTVFDISPQELAEVYAAKDRALFAQGGLQQYESQVRNADGQLRDVVFNKAVFRDVHGDVAGLIGTILDITERKQSENQLKQVVEILEQSVDFIGSASIDGRLQYHNRAARRMLGLAEDADLTGLRISDVHPDWAHQILVEQALPALHEHGVWRGETALRHKNGHEIPVSQLLVLHRDTGGKPLYYSTIMTDISARKRVEGVLEFIAQGGWEKDVESFLQALMRYLGQTLGVAYVLVDKLSGDASIAETLALYAKGDLLPNMQYSLKDTPCSNVMDGLACCYPQGVQQLFPDDRLLVDMEAESYAGQPLMDSTGQVIGLIAVMDDKPIQDIAAIGAILRMVAPRVAAEIERDRAERAIEASHQFLQQIIDTVADPVFVKDRQHRWLLLNDAMCSFMGVSREGLLGKSDYEFFPSEQADVFWAKDEEVFVSGTPNINEESFTDAAGLTHTILTTKSCFKDAQGESILVGTIKDITALKQTQFDLENTTYRLRSVLQTIPDYVWMKNVDGVYLACNHAFERFFGVAEAEIVGKSDYDYVPTELADFFRQKDKEAIDAGAVRINEEWVTLASDGSHILLETRKVPVQDAAGNVIGVLGIGRDITERKQSEEKLELLRLALDNVKETVMLVDESARLVYVNEHTCRTLGYTREELMNMSVPDFNLDYRQDAWSSHWRDLQRHGVLTFESSHRNRAGHVSPIEIVSSYFEANEHCYTLALVRDITERKRQEARFALQDYALNQINEGLFLLDEEARFVQVNEESCRALGYSREELLTMSVFDIDPDYQPEHWQTSRMHEKPGMTATLESRHRTRGGCLIDVEVKSTAIVYEGRSYHLCLVRDITERKQRDEELKLLEYALDHIGEGFYLIDENAEFVRVNAETCRALGYTHDELLGMRVFDIDPDFTPEDWQQLMVGFKNGLASKTIQTRIKTKDGLTFAAEVNANPFSYQGRNYNLALVRDITERKRVEARLALQDKALNQVGEAIYLIAEDASILQVNQGASRMLGYAQEELLTMRIPDIDPLYNEAVWPEHWADLHRRGTITLETLHRCRTGEIISVEVNANMVEYEGQRLNFALIRDITERKLAQQALAERERELRTLTDNLPDPIFRYDREGRRIYVNPAVERLSNKSAAELLGASPKDASLVGKGESEKLMAAIRHVLNTGEPSETEVIYIGPDGREQYFFNLYVPERDTDGSITGVLSIGRNITPRKLAERALMQRERELSTLVENLPTYVVRLDRRLRHVYANSAYMSAVGIAEDRLYGLHVSTFWRAENITVDEYVTTLTRVLETGVQEEVTLEWRSERGRFYSHMVRVAPELDAAGQVLGLLVLGFDITAQRREQLLDAERQRVFEAMAHGGDLAQVLAQVAGYIDASGRGMRASIMLLDESGTRLKSVAAPTLPEVVALGEIDLSQHKGCCAVAASRGERISSDRTCHHAGAMCTVFSQDQDLRGCWSEPIKAASGRMLGVVTVYLQQLGEPQASDMELLREAANLCAIAIERKHIEEQMQRHASYDSLTGLPNRRLFRQRLHEEVMRAERLSEGIALLFIDLDHFKEVNDSLGHEFGDQLLIEAAKRIQACVRESDTVARLGGDEFVVVLTQVDEVSALGHLAQTMVDKLSQPFCLDAHVVYVSASIGIAGYPLDAQDAESLVSCADHAMYAAKNDGRNTFSFFTAAIQQQVHSRLQLAGDLREAMDKGQLQVHYQPIVDIATGEVLKAEALLRWQHPTRGMVSPDVFIPVAEEHGLIHDIGDWVFRQAVMLAKEWNAAACVGTASTLRQVSVNLSPRQFAKGRIDKVWLEHIESLNVDPRSIAIEITEGLLLDDRMDIMEKLARFGMAGMQVALDDFGTGYSAMAYLKKFPIDYLKIDRSFVRDIETDPNDRAIAEAIVVMASKLGLKVIAEGVENEGQRCILDAVGCEYVQGYLYAKPMPVEQFMEFVQAS